MSSISAWLNGAPRCGQVSSIQYSSGALHDEGPVKTCPIADPLLPPNEASGLLILKSNRRWYTTGWSTVRRARWKRVWVKVALRGAILVIRQAVRTIWMYIPDELLWNGHLCCSVICCCFEVKRTKFEWLSICYRQSRHGPLRSWLPFTTTWVRLE